MNTRKTLRWLSVPFAAIGGCLAFYLFGFISAYLAKCYVGVDLFFINEWIINLVIQALAGVGFIFSGSYTAPEHKKTTAIVLCTIYCLLCVLAIIWFAITQEEHYVRDIIYSLAGTCGAIYYTTSSGLILDQDK